MLLSDFLKCSVAAKNTLFRTHCSCFYASQFRCNFKSENFRKLRVAYDDSYRIMIPIVGYISSLIFAVPVPSKFRLTLKRLML